MPEYQVQFHCFEEPIDAEAATKCFLNQVKAETTGQQKEFVMGFDYEWASDKGKQGEKLILPPTGFENSK